MEEEPVEHTQAAAVGSNPVEDLVGSNHLEVEGLVVDSKSRQVSKGSNYKDRVG